MNEADVTSTYFVLIGYSHRGLGRLVVNTFTSHELNWIELQVAVLEKFISVPFSSCEAQICIKYSRFILANQIQAKGVVTIVCRIEIRKMAEC